MYTASENTRCHSLLREHDYLRFDNCQLESIVRSAVTSLRIHRITSSSGSDFHSRRSAGAGTETWAVPEVPWHKSEVPWHKVVKEVLNFTYYPSSSLYSWRAGVGVPVGPMQFHDHETPYDKSISSTCIKNEYMPRLAKQRLDRAIVTYLHQNQNRNIYTNYAKHPSPPLSVVYNKCNKAKWSPSISELTGITLKCVILECW